jgi:hypothetical protein
VQFADVNGDGIRDAVLADIDESSVVTVILLVKRDTLKLSPARNADVRRYVEYIWDPTAGQEACRNALLPRVERVAGRLVVSTAYGEARDARDCANPQRRLLEVVRDSFELAR